MASLGERLRRQRELQGIRLSDIAAETRIGMRYLEALERDDIRTLPGTVFAKSFARQYAAYVGLNEEEIEEELRALVHPEEVLELPGQERQGASAPVPRIEPIPDAVGVIRPNHRRMALAVVALVGVVSACSMVYVYWQQRVERGAEARIAGRPAPASTVASAEKETVAAAQQPSPRPASDAPSEFPPSDGSVTFTGNGLRIEIFAKEMTWVSVSSDGKSIFSGILQPNETKRLAAAERASMVVGNAGGVEIITNGRSIGPIGPRGQVRLVMVGPDGAEITRRQPAVTDGGGDASPSPRS